MESNIKNHGWEVGREVVGGGTKYHSIKIMN